MTTIIAILACIAALWWVAHTLHDLSWQAVIVEDVDALLDRQPTIHVNLSDRQVRYLRRWGFDVCPLEERANGLWESEVTR